MDQFIPCSQIYDDSGIAEIFLDGVVRTHGLPRTIMLDRDVRFATYFWKTLWHLLGTKLKFSTPYQPQIDDQADTFAQHIRDLHKDDRLCNSRALFRGFLVWQIPWPLLETFV